MDSATKRQNAKAFITQWEGKEDGETQKFWISLLQDVLGVSQPWRVLDFEKKVRIGNETKSIDAYIKPPTKILIEQKSSDKSLTKAYRQSDGAMLTPYEQALRYKTYLPKDLNPNYIVTCNFKEFHIHDMEDPNAEPVVIKLEDLPDQVERLAFLANAEKKLTAYEQKISVEAGEIVGQIYDALLEQYQDKNNPESLKSLNKLCVRLVFCLYAEDSDLFANRLQFHDYLRAYSQDPRTALINLFKVLDTPEDNRGPYLPDDLKAFPYVNGGLFADEDIEIPRITPEIVELILQKASEGFNWSLISPTIFGAVFESTLNPETRRKGGMHYTSVENIHKVIDPLFLDELKAELKSALALKVPGTRNKRLEAFRKKLGSLTFLDPACGSGNFLTETYKCLRELENEALRSIYQGQMALGEGLSPIEVHIKQFHGIEINDFAVTVARTALWIAESQMMKETKDIVGDKLEFLPLKSSAHIHEANALRIDWNEVIPASQLSFILGNPPFVGARLMTKSQKEDVSIVFGKNWKNSGNLDYVSCWFKKSADFMQGTTISAALVATNSICQGDAVSTLWKPLLGTKIFFDFAYRTFRWDSESTGIAHVHCVIIGFKAIPFNLRNWIFEGDSKKTAKNINGYLIDGSNIFVENRKSPICTSPLISYGSFALDDGNYTIKDDEFKEIIAKSPESKKFLKPFIGAYELINHKKRYCVWLKDANPAEIRKDKCISEKVEKVRLWRSKSNRKNTFELSKTPSLFAEIRQPQSDYLAIPTVCSEKRIYLPMALLDKNTIASNQIYVVPEATLFHFGVLTSRVHMAWMRAVAGRLEMRYRYSAGVVYNNFPWPNPSDKQKQKIEETAKAILEAREAHPGNSLADLYDPNYVQEDLGKAHENNDRAVMNAYGFKPSMSESELVAELFKLYEVRVKDLEQVEEEEEKREDKASKKK